MANGGSFTIDVTGGAGYPEPPSGETVLVSVSDGYNIVNLAPLSVDLGWTPAPEPIFGNGEQLPGGVSSAPNEEDSIWLRTTAGGVTVYANGALWATVDPASPSSQISLPDGATLSQSGLAHPGQGHGPLFGGHRQLHPNLRRAATAGGRRGARSDFALLVATRDNQPADPIGQSGRAGHHGDRRQYRVRAPGCRRRELATSHAARGGAGLAIGRSPSASAAVISWVTSIAVDPTVTGPVFINGGTVDSSRVSVEARVTTIWISAEPGAVLTAGSGNDVLCTQRAGNRR